MSQLLSISFDAPTAPSLTLGKIEKNNNASETLHGWGFAWYTESNNIAVVIKDPAFQSKLLQTKVLNDWKRFQSTLFLCHLRGAAKRYNEQDTQPFYRTYAGRSWVFLHNGDLDKNVFSELKTGNNPIFEPVGKTDSEHVFCWMLNTLNHQQARTLKESTWENLYQICQKINSYGTANLMISDGYDLIVYQDKNGFNPLYWDRKHPPHEKYQFSSPLTKLEFDITQIVYRTYFMFANEKTLLNEPHQMWPGQMLVTRRAALVWDSHSHLKDSTLMARKKADTAIDHHKSKLQESQKNILHISHITTYAYEKPVELSKHYVRLHPLNNRYQQILEHSLQLSIPSKSETFDDVFGNRVTLIQIDTPYTELIVTMQAKVQITPPTLTRSILNNRNKIPLLWMPWQRQMMLPYLLPPELPESQLAELTDFAFSFVKRNDQDVIDTLTDINQTIYRDFEYVSGSTRLETTPFEVFLYRRGVCQDFTNLFICLTRLLGIPARYRVGYIYTGADYENTKQSEASHAWVEIYLPWLGWRGFDPTNGIMIGKDHVLVACGRCYFDATPTSGTLFKGGGQEKLMVQVKVERES